MSDEKLTPELAVRLLRAKAGELEHIVLAHTRPGEDITDIEMIRADIAFVASLLADHIERAEQS